MEEDHFENAARTPERSKSRGSLDDSSRDTYGDLELLKRVIENEDEEND